MNKPKRKYTRHPGSNPPGQPSKKDLLTIDIAYNLAKSGHTLAEIADIIGICEATIYNWLASDKKFLEAIENGRPAAIKRMENSLFHRGLGYSHPEEVIFQYKGNVVRAETTKQYPPDTAAAFIWLKNVDPEHWRDKTEIEVREYVHEENKDKTTEELRAESERLAHEIIDRRTAITSN